MGEARAGTRAIGRGDIVGQASRTSTARQWLGGRMTSHTLSAWRLGVVGRNGGGRARGTVTGEARAGTRGIGHRGDIEGKAIQTNTARQWLGGRLTSHTLSLVLLFRSSALFEPSLSRYRSEAIAWRLGMVGRNGGGRA